MVISKNIFIIVILHHAFVSIVIENAVLYNESDIFFFGKFEIK